MHRRLLQAVAGKQLQNIAGPREINATHIRMHRIRNHPHQCIEARLRRARARRHRIAHLAQQLNRRVNCRVRRIDGNDIRHMPPV
jgi:hypothetical protein